MSNKMQEIGAVDRAKRAIREMVGNGDLVPGQRLVEPDLAALLSVSRATLREAFSALEGEGLLKIERYKGASVRRLDEREIVEAFEIRELLEGLAARRAALRFAEAADRARLAELVEAMERCVTLPGASQEFRRLNTEFHQLIQRAAGSAQLQGMVPYMSPPTVLRVMHQRLADVASLQRAAAEHRAIAEALLAGDAVGAEDAMRRHIRSTMQSASVLSRADGVQPVVEAPRRRA